MNNVLRVFNDACGVVKQTQKKCHAEGSDASLLTSLLRSHRHHPQELCQRTGRRPNYQYLQLGCSKKAENAMLNFARQQVGKPFSSRGMARSLIWPRESPGDSWYCAELVAACLQHGGLMSRDSQTGAATPHSLYKMYKQVGAVQANPYALRQKFGMNQRTIQSLRDNISNTLVPRPLAFDAQPLVAARAYNSPPQPQRSRVQQRSDSPPRMAFKVIQARANPNPSCSTPGSISLSLSSLSMSELAR